MTTERLQEILYNNTCDSALDHHEEKVIFAAMKQAVNEAIEKSKEEFWSLYNDNKGILGLDDITEIADKLKVK